MNYWDTSALLKLYVPEPDSPQFLDLIAETGRPIGSSAIAAVELLCAAHRKEQVGDLKKGGAASAFARFQQDCASGRIVSIPFGDEVLSQAQAVIRAAVSRSREPLLRSLDVIHVATALILRAPAVVATDRRLREMAASVNLKTLP